MTEVEVKAIHNATSEVIHCEMQGGGSFEVQPRETLKGHWVVTVDETKEGPVSSPNEVWYVAPDKTFWGSFAFTPPSYP